MFLLIAPAKRGKSWCLVTVGKAALEHRHRVLHVTLEMSEEEVAQRYVQAMFGLSVDASEHETTRVAQFKKDELGRYTSIEYENIMPDLLNSATRAKVAAKMRRSRIRNSRVLIKEFPMASLSVAQLIAYLDYLKRKDGFEPDVLIVDYPDLMEIDAKNWRTDVGRVFRQLRGIATARNLALVTATQGNRISAHARELHSSHVAEDWSKIGTADIICTYNQTIEERQYGLARILVDAARGVRDKFTVLVSQNYGMGQFCLDDVYFSKNVREEVERVTGEEKEDAG